MTPDGRPIPWPEGEDVGTYEDSQSMVHSKIGSKKTYVPTQFSFEPACKSDPLSSLVNYIVVAAGILEASDNTHTHTSQTIHHATVGPAGSPPLFV